MSAFSDDDKAAIQAALQEAFGSTSPSQPSSQASFLNNRASASVSSPSAEPNSSQAFTEEEWKQRQKEAADLKGPGGSLAALALGGARALSFGGSDVALTQTGALDKETINKLRDLNPNWDASGELLGVALPLLSSGGSSLLAQGGKAAGSAVSGVNRIGQAASALVKTGLETGAEKSLARKILETSVAHGAGSAVEGLFYGGGQLVSDAALGDPDINAEKVLSTLGYSSLLGGALGTTFGGIAEAGPSLVQKGKSLVSSLKGTLGVEGGLLEGAAAKAVDVVSDVSSALSNVPKESIQKNLKNPFGLGVGGDLSTSARSAAISSEIPTNEIKRGFIRDFGELVDTNNKTKAQLYEVRKVENQELLKTLDADQSLLALNAAREQADQIFDGVQGMAKNKARFTDQASVDEALEHSLAAKTALRKATSASEANNILLDLRQQVDDVIPWNNMMELDKGSRNVVDRLMGIRNSLKDNLENPLLWGEAGLRTQAFNEVLAPFFKSEEAMRKAYMAKQGGKWEINPQKVVRYINDPDNARNMLREASFRDYFNRAEELYNQIDQMGSGPFESADMINQGPLAQARGVKDLFKEPLEKKLAQLEAIDDVKDLGKGIGGNILSPGGAAAGATAVTLGFALGGPVGAALAGGSVAAFNLLKHPQNLVRGLAEIERLTSKVDKGVSKALDFFIKMRGDASLPPLEKALPAVVVQRELSKKSREERKERMEEQKNSSSSSSSTSSSKNSTPGLKERFQKDMSVLSQAVSNPDALTDVLSKKLKPLQSVAPNIGMYASQKAAEVLNALYERAPKSKTPDFVPAFQRKFVPSDAEMAKWYRFKKAIDDPQSVLEDLQKGKLSVEGVDALKVGYPKMFSSIQQNLMERLTSLQKELPYKDRAQLSLLFDVPVDQSFKPQMVMTLQNTFSEQVELPAAKGSLQNLGKGREKAEGLTSVQKIENR